MKDVSIFIPCLVDLLLPSIGEATVALLRRLGLKVVYHEGQTCCGQPALTAGFRKEAGRMAKHFIRVFGDDEVVVCPSGSCVHMVKHLYPELLEGEPEWLGRAQELSGRVYELSQFIVDVLGQVDTGASFAGKVAYHESCMLLRGLGVSEQPKKLILAAEGTEMVPLADASGCCGFGGRFSVRYPEISQGLVEEKVNNYIESGADLLVLGEPGCLLNISGYLSRNHPDKKAVHIADFLAGPPEDRHGTQNR